jgi:hypothetical protein
MHDRTIGTLGGFVVKLRTESLLHEADQLFGAVDDEVGRNGVKPLRDRLDLPKHWQTPLLLS